MALKEPRFLGLKKLTKTSSPKFRFFSFLLFFWVKFYTDHI